MGDFGLFCLKRFFAQQMAGYTIRLANAAAIIDNSAFEGADIFVMPGGADLPYCKKLNGMGNKNIRAFVENGGTYLGICAGAYYACKDIEYHKGRDDEICGPRELALIDATAIGSLPELAPYYNDRLQTVSAVALQTKHQANDIRAYYHGGCKFMLHEETMIHAHYPLPDAPAAIIEKAVGLGRVVLSGVHLEIGAQDLQFYPMEEGDDPEILAKLVDNITNSHMLLTSLLAEKIPS